MAIFIFNVPAITMKCERFALAGVPLLTRTDTAFCVTDSSHLQHKTFIRTPLPVLRRLFRVLAYMHNITPVFLSLSKPPLHLAVYLRTEKGSNLS